MNTKPKYWNKNISLKSIVLIVKSHTDSNGNTYFAAEAIVNNKYIIKIAYQYGYSDSVHMLALSQALTDLGMIDYVMYHREISDRGIAFYTDHTELLGARVVHAFGEGGM